MQFRKMSIKQYYGLLVSGLILLIIGLLLGTINPSLLWITSVFIFIICSVGIRSYWKKISEDEAKESVSPQVTVYISAGLYGIIAGFAIKNVIESTIKGIIGEVTKSFEDTASAEFSQILLSLQQSPYEILMLTVFLATAIPFYHGAMIFLSEKSHKKPETPIGMISHFGSLFIQAIIFLTISIVLQNFVLVVFSLIILMIVDSAWIILSQKTLRKPPLGWLASNLGFTTALLLTVHLSWNLDSSAFILALICITRTVIDYAGFQEVYFPTRNKGLGI